MNFKSAADVEAVVYAMRLADYPRGKNRARINNLFNGTKPFDNDAENPVNVNFLGGTVIAHDARAQFSAAFTKPGKYFTCTTDYGPEHKRSLWSTIVTKEINRIMTRSLVYYETLRSKFAMDVLHGIGPSAWRNEHCWLPSAIGIEDVGIPSKTLLTMENLPFYYLYRSYTLPELIKLTHDKEVAKKAGWNLGLVDQCIKWIDDESKTLMASSWPEVWSPEKTAERIKGDGAVYAADGIPTIDCFDFYFWNDDGGVEGWNRRIILDAWSSPEAGASGSMSMQRNSSTDFARNQFLFNSGKRKYASKLSEMVAFQFADLSSVAPFQYHSVRSIGFLLYAVCHLQNRMRCRFNASVFEALMNYYRVKSMDDVDRALKLDMVNQGFIDETIHFVPPAERWQVNAGLIELGLRDNQAIIDRNSSSWTQQQGQSQAGDRKTKFQVMAEMNQSTALVSAGLNQAYRYQEPEYREIFRRFCRTNSRDGEVLEFRAACLRQGVPEKVLKPECWDLQPTRIMGAGNKTMEMAISEQLMQMRNLYDPEPQREILRDVTLAITDDPARALRLVPEQPLKISDSVHDAQLSMGTLMQGFPVAIKTGQNHQEYVMVLLQELGGVVGQIEQSGGMAPPDKLQGFQMVAQNIAQHLKVLSGDETQKPFVAQSGKKLGEIMNLVKAFAQRLQEQAKKQQANGNGASPETQGKVQSMLITAQAKAKLGEQSHAAKTAQRQVSFEMEERRKQKQFDLDQQRKNLETVHELQTNRLKSTSE